jgi:hypothetical protein
VDGETITLKPHDKVQVLKSEVEKPKLELKREKETAVSVARLKKKKREEAKPTQETLTTAFEQAKDKEVKGLRLEGEQVSAKERAGFEKQKEKLDLHDWQIAKNTELRKTEAITDPQERIDRARRIIKHYDDIKDPNWVIGNRRLEAGIIKDARREIYLRKKGEWEPEIKEEKQPAKYKDIEVEIEAVREKTGEKIKVKQNAQKALDKIDSDINKLNKFLECLKGVG